MILVTGGAGYVGSHCVKELLARGRDVVIFDNLDQGVHEAVLSEHFVEGDLLVSEDLQRVFESYQIDSVMHFAALSQVGEAMAEPGRYWANNVIGSLTLIEAAVAADCLDFVFSSTCATYGEHDNVVLDETLDRIKQNLGEKVAMEYLSILDEGVLSVSIRLDWISRRVRRTAIENMISNKKTELTLKHFYILETLRRRRIDIVFSFDQALKNFDYPIMPQGI